MPGPTPKPRHKKTCPACSKEFETRWGRQVCCSKSCARVLQAKVHGPTHWKGGVNKHASGYLKAKAPAGHPLADTAGYVMQHRLVMEAHLGRFLGRNEYVHHKNGKRDDNRIENLELWHSPNNKKDPPGQRMADRIESIVARVGAGEDLRVVLNQELMGA